MSQEALAEAAQISTAAISALERGSRQAPYHETALLICDALQLTGDERSDFERAAANARSDRIRKHKEKHVGNFPVHLGVFVGRVADIDELIRLLAINRLVTLTGAGGIGKTRVALETITRLASADDEVHFVDLAPIGERSLILRAIASVLGAGLTDPDVQVHAIASHVGQRRVLLVVDNCEHVIADVAFALDAVLRNCPNLTVFATSRQRIGISGEAVYRLPTLPLPAKGVKLSADSSLRYGALELFVRRAQAADSSFVFSEAHVESVADICRRLDGIPLAIEFAAARVPSLGLPMLLRRLSERFDLLTGGAPSVHARQQTMRATIAWSFDSLSLRERRLTSQLSIFRGGCTVEAAEATCDLDYENLDELLDDLSSLVEKSVVSLDGYPPATHRYRLLEPIREYARDQLSPAEYATLSRRHAEWAAETVERWTDLQFSKPRLLWNHEVEPEIPNIQSAIGWALGTDGDPILAARIATGPRSIISREPIEAIIAGLDANSHPKIAARLWWRLSGEYSGIGKARTARSAIALFASIGDRTFSAISYSNLAIGLARSGNLEEGEEASRTALGILERDGSSDSLVYAYSLTTLADVHFLQGRSDDERADLQRALLIATALEDEWLVVRVRLSLGEVEFLAEDLPRAIQIIEDVLLAADRPAFRRERMVALCYLAAFRILANQPADAANAALEALSLGRGREPIVIARAVGYLAGICVLYNNLPQAARLYGYFQAWCARESYLPNAMEAACAAIVTRSLHEALSTATIAEYAAEGAAFTQQRAMTEAQLYKSV